MLILAENALTALPMQIGQLQHLHTLDVGHNQLDRLPETLGTLVELRDFLYLLWKQ